MFSRFCVLSNHFTVSKHCFSAIKPPPPRKGLPDKKPPPAKPIPPPAAPKNDPNSPSPKALADLKKLGEAAPNPSKASAALAIAKNLQSQLALYPAPLQKFNFLHGLALANSGNIPAAEEKFTLAAAANAPDQALAQKALTEHARFLLDSPDSVGKAFTLAQSALSRSQAGTPAYATAGFRIACAQYLQGKADASLESIQKISQFQPADEALSQ